MEPTAAGFDFSSALMKNQKAAQLVSEVSAFEAVQTADGLGLLFSISDDGALYLCAEQVGADVAWTPVNLTAGLGTGPVVAKLFAVVHDPKAGTIDLAQVVLSAADGSETLYVLGGLSDASDAGWMTATGKRDWVARPYDGGGAGGEIAYVLLPQTRGQGGQACVAGVRSAATGFVSNYEVDLDPKVTARVWRSFETAENYDRLLAHAIGRPQGSPWPGLYELVSLGKEIGLTFTPMADGAAPVRKLTAPTGASAIAALPADEDGHTHLFVAGSGGLQLFPAAGQGREATGTMLIASSLFAGADSLEAHSGDTYVTVWARNGRGQVVSTRAPLAEIEQPEAWSAPIPLLPDAEQIASVSSLATGGSEIYVHGSEQKLTKLEQDPVTTEWRRQALTLPALAVSDMVQVHTFTTHVNVRGADSLPAPGAKFELRSASPCAVYVEGAHTRLSADAVEVEASAGGTVTIVQQTDTLAAVPYLVADATGKVTEINPMAPALAQLGEVSSGSDLDRTVTDETGESSPLVPPSVSAGEKQAVASAVAELHGTAKTLPPGAPGGPSLTASALAGATIDSSWTLSFSAGGVGFERGASDFDAGDVLESWWGDLVLWLEHDLEHLSRVVVTIAEGVAHVFVEIAGEIYHAVLRCLADAMATFQLILRKLVEAFETLVKWLGMILNWQDILRTHAVLKNVIGCYLKYSVGELSTFKQTVDEQLEKLDQRIEAWTGTGPTSQSPSSTAAGNPLSPDQLHPAAHWGGHQQSQNIRSAASTGSAPGPAGETIETLLAELGGVLEKEDEDLKKAWKQIEAVFAEATTLTAGEIVEKLLGILAVLAVETVQTILDAVFDVLEYAAGGIVSALEETIEIPVLSRLYKTFSGGAELSFLDLGCLVAAIPATIVYKLGNGHAPFPEGEFTQALIEAKDLEEIRRLFAESGAVATLETGAGNSNERTWNIIVDYIAFASSIPAAVLASFKAIEDNFVTSVTYAVTYVFYCAPCFTVFSKQSWDMIFGEAITGLSLAKNLVDIPLYKYKKGAENGAVLEGWNAASPWVELVMDAIWMIPTWGPPCREPSSAVAWVAASGGTLFNLAGMCALPISMDLEPVSKMGWILGMEGGMIGYGVLMAVAAEIEVHSKAVL